MSDTTGFSEADRILLSRLGAALRAAGPPASVTEAARSVYTWRTIDAELAELVFDSAVDEPAGVRSTTTDRQMTFTSPGLNIEMMVSTADTRRLVGQIDPAGAQKMELRHSGGIDETVPDELGRFMFDDVAVGPVSLRCTLADGSVVQTEWTVV